MLEVTLQDMDREDWMRIWMTHSDHPFIPVYPSVDPTFMCVCLHTGARGQLHQEPLLHRRWPIVEVDHASDLAALNFPFEDNLQKMVKCCSLCSPLAGGKQLVQSRKPYYKLGAAYFFLQGKAMCEYLDDINVSKAEFLLWLCTAPFGSFSQERCVGVDCQN